MIRVLGLAGLGLVAFVLSAAIIHVAMLLLAAALVDRACGENCYTDVYEGARDRRAGHRGALAMVQRSTPLRAVSYVAMANPDAGDPATMRAVVIDSFGGPEQLHGRQMPVRSPGDGQVLIRLDGARRFSADGLDAALLTAGGPEADAAVATVRPGGRAAYPTGVQPAPASTAGIEPQAFNGEPDGDLLERFMGLIGDRPLDVHIAHEFTFDQIPAAHHTLRDHHVGVGKLAIAIKGVTGRDLLAGGTGSGRIADWSVRQFNGDVGPCAPTRG